MSPLPFLRAGLRPCALIVAAGGLAACSEEFLMADYQLAPDDPAFVAAIRRGERQPSDIFTGPPCVLNVDNDTTPLQSASSGTRGQAAVTVISVNPVNDAMNTPSCPTITNLVITVAATDSSGWQVGAALPSTRMVITAGGTTYSTGASGGYFAAKITGRNQRTGAASARFAAVATAPSTPSMLVAQGSFNMR